jgi:putative protease
MSDLSPSSHRSPPLELLSPAGTWECARAAVANGADAIYFGLQKFNARLRASNFSDEDLPDLMVFLHQHGVRGFVAMNTLIFTRELDEAADQLRRLQAAGVDAIIVQDLGLIRMARAVAPRLEIHASTQMTLTSPEGLQFIDAGLGLDRAVLARELSLRELKKFAAADPAAAAHGVPLEVFVHGALCVAYSGQCLTSEALGQRSANRGECAQACRMPYQLVVDGEIRDLGDQRYLLSPQDLAAINEIPSLINAGVRSFKIEGRLKTPEYVASVTRAYRAAIDAATAAAEPEPEPEPEPESEPESGGAAESPKASVPPKSLAAAGEQAAAERLRYELEMAFSRGLSTGWMHGVNHQELVHARYGKKRGALLGTVVRTGADWVELRLVAPVMAGDGVVFENPADTDREMGGRIFQLDQNRLYFDRRASVNPERVMPGTRVFKTDDPRLNAELRSTFAGVGSAPGRVPVFLRITGRVGERLCVQAGAEFPNGALPQCVVESSLPLVAARTRPLTQAVAEEQMGRLGGTPFHLAGLHFEVEDGVMLPLSELNRIRRELVDVMPGPWGVRPDAAGNFPVVSAVPRVAEAAVVTEEEAAVAAPQLTVLCRSLEQIEVALECGVKTIYADFEDIRRGAQAVALVRAGEGGSRLLLATPRIQKAGEEGFFKVIERAEPDGVLIRNLGAIRYFSSRPHLVRVGDFSLNVANPLTADFFMSHGLQRLTVSYDLNLPQVVDLVRGAPPSWFEVTLHQHMPMFHMEHCVFAAFMSQGRDYTDCGRPCEKHRVELRDRVGQLHPLLADVGCRNTLFRGQAQTGARFYSELKTNGIRHFRVELLRENAAGTRTILEAYQRLLAGADDGGTLWQKLRATSQLGVTEGTLVSA